MSDRPSTYLLPLLCLRLFLPQFMEQIPDHVRMKLFAIRLRRRALSKLRVTGPSSTPYGRVGGRPGPATALALTIGRGRSRAFPLALEERRSLPQERVRVLFQQHGQNEVGVWFACQRSGVKANEVARGGQGRFSRKASTTGWHCGVRFRTNKKLLLKTRTQADLQY